MGDVMPEWDAQGNQIQPQSASPKQEWDASGNQVYSQGRPTLDLTNPQGQGTYAMWNTNGQKIPVPYSQVHAAAHQGYKFDTNPNPAGLTPAQQFQKDYNYATTGPGHEEAYAQSDRNAPLPMQFISGVVKGMGTLGKPVIDVVGRLGGLPQSAIDSSFQAQTPMEMAGKVGMMGAVVAPAAMMAPAATAGGLIGGGLGVGIGNMVADATDASPENRALLQDVGSLGGGVLGAKVGGTLPRPAVLSPPGFPGLGGPETPGSGLAGKISTFVNPKSQWTGAAQSDIPWMKLASRVGPAGTGQSALGVKDSLAADLKANLSQVPGVLDAKNPLEFSKAAEHFLNETAAPEYHGVSDPLANELIKPDYGIGSGLPNRVASFKVPSTGNPLGTHPTIAEAENALQEVNGILTKSYNAPANANDPAQIQNLEGIAGQLRSNLNNRIGELSGLPPQTVSALRQRVGALSNIVDNSRERYLANIGGATSPPVAAAGAGNVRSIPSMGIKAALTQPLQNYQFRRDLSGAGQVAPQLDPNSPLGQYYALKSLGQGNQ